MDPRVARTHDAVIKAAQDLLVEGGPAALTVDGVVARSGVAKSTVYRHWATRDDLVVAVLMSCVPELREPDDADFEGALLGLVQQMLGIVQEEHWRRFLPSLMLLSQEADKYAEVDRSMKESQLAVIGDVLRLGVAEGVLPDSVLDDLETATNLLVGPILMAGLTGATFLDDDFARQAAHQFVAGQARVPSS
jgi:AcrR family transcriptional regulator